MRLKKDKYYFIQISMPKLCNGLPDPLYKSRFTARWNGRHFLIGKIPYRRSLKSVTVIREAHAR